jgi:glutathione S-transferase
MSTTSTTTTSTTTDGSGTTTTVTTTVSAVPAATIDATSPLVVYNWPMMGRFGAQFLMLDHVGIKYEHIETLEGIISVSSVFGAQTGNFAPPNIVDGDMILSQSYSQCIYIGRKAGLEPAGFCEFKAMQMMADIDDWLLNNFKPEKTETLTDSKYLKTFLEGEDGKPGRFAAYATMVEFNIEGDFVFGAEPCCVDFFLTNQLDFVYHTILQKLQDHTGTDLLAYFPKIAGVAKRIRELPSYQQVSYADPEKRPVICKEEWFKAMGFEISYFPLEGVIENYGKVVSPPAEPSVQEAEPPEL